VRQTDVDNARVNRFKAESGNVCTYSISEKNEGGGELRFGVDANWSHEPTEDDVQEFYGHVRDVASERGRSRSSAESIHSVLTMLLNNSWRTVILVFQRGAFARSVEAQWNTFHRLYGFVRHASSW
jgi:hypothetical protein